MRVMTQYKNKIPALGDTVQAMPWSGDISAINVFLLAFPPALNPKVTEDNPNANGVVSNDGITLVVYPLDGNPVNAALTDMLIRSDVDHGLSTMTAAAFGAAYDPV